MYLKNARKFLAQLCVVLCLSTVVVAVVATYALSASGCADVLLLWVRASGANLVIEGAGVRPEPEAFFKEVASNLTGYSVKKLQLGDKDGNRELDPNGYPAVIGSGWATYDYFQSVQEGVTELVNFLNHRYSPGPIGSGCYKEVAAMGGFSQGAHLLGAALQDPRLISMAKRHIGFTALYGDPMYNAGDPYERYRGVKPTWVKGNEPGYNVAGYVPFALTRTHGFVGMRSPYVTEEFSGRVGSYCDYWDSMCQDLYGTRTQDSHTTAYPSWIDHSADTIAPAVRRKYLELNPPPPALYIGQHMLWPGAQLAWNRYILSADGRFVLVLQPDGNLVLWGPGNEALWASRTDGSGAVMAVMQYDGNLVLYRADGTAVWASGTKGQDGASLVVQPDGNVVIWNSSNQPVWATNTTRSTAGMRSFGSYKLDRGQGLRIGEYLRSKDKRYFLVLQGDGNLVLYGPGYKVLWSSNTGGQGVEYAAMQSDGNFVLWTKDRPVWATRTDNRGADAIVVQDDGNVVVYKPDGAVLWASGTRQP